MQLHPLQQHFSSLNAIHCKGDVGEEEQIDDSPKSELKRSFWADGQRGGDLTLGCLESLRPISALMGPSVGFLDASGSVPVETIWSWL